MKVTFLDASGAQQEASLSPNIYQAANDRGMTLDAYLASEFKTDEAKYGTVLQQMMASAGLYTQDDPSLGIRKPTMKQVYDGACDTQFKAQGSAISADAVPASRILFPAAILQLVENQLYGNRNSEIAMFDTFIASKQAIAGTRYEYPVLDYSRPSQANSSRIAQLAEPNLMMTLTTSDKAGTVPTFSLGLMISDQALQSQTLDFVALSMTRQAEIEAANRLDACIEAMVNGDVDTGQAALSANLVTAYDSSISTAGTITQKAWLKWLANNRRIRSIDICMMTIDTFLAVEARAGKPLKTEDSTAMPFSQRPDIIPSLLNLSIGAVKVFIVENTVIPDNVIVGFDSRYAMRKITNSQANYQAAEQLVLRRANTMRWDWGYTVHRLYDQAWDVLSLATS